LQSIKDSVILGVRNPAETEVKHAIVQSEPVQRSQNSTLSFEEKAIKNEEVNLVEWAIFDALLLYGEEVLANLDASGL